jgi:hypothetical protein
MSLPPALPNRRRRRPAAALVALLLAAALLTGYLAWTARAATFAEAASPAPLPARSPAADEVITHLATLAGDYLSVAYSDTLLYGGRVNQLALINAANPLVPTEFNHFPLKNYLSVDSNPSSIRLRGSSAYVTSKFLFTTCCAGGYFEILDVTHPRQVNALGSFQYSGLEGVAVADDFAYLTSWSYNLVPELVVVDISDPLDPDVLSSYGARGGSAVEIAGGNVYVPVGVDGLKIFDVTDPLSPTVIGFYPLPGVTDVKVVDGLAYLTEWNAGLHILDVTSPATPTLVSTYSLPDKTEAVQILAGHAYLANGENGVQVLDVRDPANPILVAQYDTPGHAFRLALGGNRIFAIDRNGPLHQLWYAPPLTTEVGTLGGGLDSPRDRLTYEFPAGTFTTTVSLHHQALPNPHSAPSLIQVPLQRAFQARATLQGAGNPLQVEPSGAFTLTLSYTDRERGGIMESSLALFYWDGSGWVQEPTSQVDPVANTLTATPDHLGTWGVFGKTLPYFLSLISWPQSPSPAPSATLTSPR